MYIYIYIYIDIYIYVYIMMYAYIIYHSNYANPSYIIYDELFVHTGKKRTVFQSSVR